jgi:hypothetical protein
MELTFENSGLVAEHHQLDIPVGLGLFARRAAYWAKCSQAVVEKILVNHDVGLKTS